MKIKKCYLFRIQFLYYTTKLELIPKINKLIYHMRFICFE